MQYFVISNSDGDVSVRQINKEELVRQLQEDMRTGFLPCIEDQDPNYWGDNMLIIKGEIVVPRPKEIIQSFDID